MNKAEELIEQVMEAARGMRVVVQGSAAEGQLRDGTLIRAVKELGGGSYRVIRMDDSDRPLYKARSFSDAIEWANDYIKRS